MITSSVSSSEHEVLGSLGAVAHVSSSDLIRGGRENRNALLLTNSDWKVKSEDAVKML